MRDITMDPDEDYGLILPTSAPSLREISAFHIAAELLRHIWIIPELTPSRAELKTLFGDNVAAISSFLGKLELPQSLINMIMEQIYSIDRNLGYWTWSEENTCYAIYARDQHAFVYFPRCYDDTVWRHDDFTIDIERTVKNLMKCDQFNDLQRFKLACSYCLVDEIERLWPLVVSNWDPSVISLISNRYVKYWVEEKMVGGIPRNSQDDLNMIQVLSDNNRPAYDYYWSRLNAQHQVDVILGFIRSNITFPFEYLFPKLSLQQWIELVNEYPDNIMCHLIFKYSRDDRKTENILRIWTHIRDMMDEKIFRLMMQLCFEHNCQTNQDCLHRKIWRNSGDHLRKTQLNELFDIRCHDFLDSPKIPAFFGFDLRSVDYDRKSTYFRERSTSIARCYSSSDFEKLTSWCFTASEIARFKAELQRDVELCMKQKNAPNFLDWKQPRHSFSCINRL